MSDERGKMLTPLEAARIAGCGRSTIRRACAMGAIKAVQVGRNWAIRRSDLDAWLADGHYKPNMARYFPRKKTKQP